MKDVAISERRRAIGLTQAQLADRLGVATTTVFRWETGAVKPSLVHAQHLKDVLYELSEKLSPLDEVLLLQQEPVAITDISSCCMGANDAFLAMAGIDVGSAVGFGIGELFPDVKMAALEKFGEPLENAMRRRIPTIKFVVTDPVRAGMYQHHRIEMLLQLGFSTRYIHEISSPTRFAR